MNTINGYLMTTDFTTDNSGFGRWGFARKDNLDVFIKEFLSPVYPVENGSLSAEQFQKKRKYCDEFVQRKLRLYQALLQCVSGNNVVILDFFRYGTKYYIVTEKVDNASLSPQEIYSLAPTQKFMLAKAICFSVDELHRLQIIHGDLKPENILLKQTIDGFFTSKIIDFDSSFFAGETSEKNQELEGDLVYLAPEVFLKLRGEKIELTTKLDVFSLGVLFCQYFTGSLPSFNTSEGCYAFEAVLNGFQQNFPVDFSPRLTSLIKGMMHRDPDKRPSLKWVIGELEQIEKTEFKTKRVGLFRWHKK